MGLANKIENFTPTPESIEAAKKQLAFLKQSDMPADLLNMLVKALKRYSEGKSVVIATSDDLCTTQDAADFLQVSRRHLTRMLDDKLIPSFRIGTHRRLRIEDVMSYKKKLDEERLSMLDEITAIAEEAEGSGDL